MYTEMIVKILHVKPKMKIIHFLSVYTSVKIVKFVMSIGVHYVGGAFVLLLDVWVNVGCWSRTL
jgi:hypothetical protein